MFDETHRENLANVAQATADYYYVRYFVAQMQGLLWDRAEAAYEQAVGGFPAPATATRVIAIPLRMPERSEDRSLMSVQIPPINIAPTPR